MLSTAIDFINQGLDALRVSPIQKRKVSQKRYSEEKMKNISEALTKNIFNTVVTNGASSVKENDGNAIIQLLKDEFNETTER